MIGFWGAASSLAVKGARKSRTLSDNKLAVTPETSHLNR